MANLIPCYTLELPVNTHNLFDINGVQVGSPLLHHVYACEANHPDLGTKLYKLNDPIAPDNILDEKVVGGTIPPIGPPA